MRYWAYMSKILAIANQKGGVAKTTTAINLSACLATFGQKVLVVDTDPQGNTTSGLGIAELEAGRCIYDCLINDLPLKMVIQSTAIETLFVVPATIQLAGAEVELVPAVSREYKLKRALQAVTADYDYIIIDCPPSLGLLTLNAMTAAHGVLIPIQCEYYALEGLSLLLNTINLVKGHLNPDLEIFGAVLTMFDARTNLSIEVVDEVKKFFKDKVFASLISRNVKLSEAPSYGLPIILYDPKSKGAEQYMDLAKEVLERG